MPGPFDRLLHDLSRVQARRAALLPTPRQLRKARADLESMIGKAPMSRLTPLFQTLRQLESDMNAIASDAVASARDMLHGAIRAGRDTFTARKELTAAEQAQAREQAMNDKILAQAEKARRDAIARSVEAECMELRSAILAKCAAVLPGFQVDVVIESHRLTTLLEARARRDEVEAARAELQQDLENLNIRLAETQTAIDQLHAKPDRSEAENGQAHFMLLDQADIKALIEAATAQLEELTLPALGDLERGWRDAQLQARFKARAAVMAELEARLMQMAQEARDVLGPGQLPDLRYRPCALMRQAAQATIV